MMKKTGGGASKRAGAPNYPSQPATDLIALGSKSKDSRGLGNDTSASYRMPPSKKSKLHSVSPSLQHIAHPLSRLTSSSEAAANRMSPTIPDSTAPCIDCPPDDLVYRVVKHMDSNKDQVEGLLCGAVRNLRLNRTKPDTTIILSVLYLAKVYPTIFNNESVIESLCGLLKRDVGLDYNKSKTNNIVAIVACSLLMKVLEKEGMWPTLIIQVYLDDSFSDRIWVDHPDCQPFVKNILTAFGTKTAKKEENEEDNTKDIFEDAIISPRYSAMLKTVQTMALDVIKDRLSRRQTDLPINTVSMGQNHVAVGAALQVKFLIQTLTAACGLQEIRTTAIHKLDMWLQNPKLSKSASDLLHSICLNCDTHSQEDVDVIGGLTKVRFKSKVHLNQYLISIKELIKAHEDNLKTLLSYVLYNELSNSRNQSNMAVVSSLLQNHPEGAAKTLASVCQELLLQQEDYSRHVRTLLREIVRLVKHEIQFTSLALGLMQEPDMEKYGQLDQSHKERFISATSDLLCLTMLLCLSPQAKDAINVASGKKKAVDSFVSNPDAVYIKFKTTVSEIQHDSLWWMQSIVIPRLTTSMNPNANYYISILYKLLFLRAAESYNWPRDNWPPEAERGFMVKACHDVPVKEDTLLRIAAIGISQENPVAAGDTLELISQLAKRAAPMSRPDLNPIQVTRLDFIDTLLSMCQYHHPSTIQLPPDYVPPSLAISNLYWGALQNLLIVISLNPSTIGHQAWTQYPMLKALMEMVIVNRFSYPPVTLVDEEVRSQMVGKEMQMGLLEKSEILEFESHLAAATTRLVVTEESSLLLSQVIAMDPQGDPRRPPERVLEQLSSLSTRFQLGTLLCRSRQPDFLLEIINRHGENQSMSWLPDLVASSKSDVGLLPVQCLCEFLLIHESEAEKLSSGGIHANELVMQLRKFLVAENLDEPVQVLQYFLKRLYSPQTAVRNKARKALTLILTDAEEMDTGLPKQSFKWLLNDFIQLPHYATVIRPRAIESLQNAAFIESDPLCVLAYVRFLANDLRQFENLSDAEESYEKSTLYARMASHLLVNRRIIIESVFSLVDEKLSESDELNAAESFMVSSLEIFVTHLRLARERELRRRIQSNDADRDGVPWSNSQDEIYVRWPNNFGAATLHILVPQASIILLGYGPPSIVGKRNVATPALLQHNQLYHDLMNLWFSEEGYVIPQACLMDTQEEALLIPDWLRLKMLRSEVTPATRRLAFAAVRGLEVEQIVLFVQSFGIPVESMNLLLQIIDSQCDSNRDVILNATSGNASYMHRLLQVQKMRGCSAGTKVAELLASTLDESAKKTSPSDVIDLRDDGSDTPMEVDSSDINDLKAFQDESRMRALLLQLFSSNPGSTSASWSNLLRSISQENPQSLLTAQFCIQSLYTLVFTDLSIDFISFLYNSQSRACCLLRALARIVNPAKTIKTTLEMLKEIINYIYENGKKVMEKLGLKTSALHSFCGIWRSRNSSADSPSRRKSRSASEQGANLRQSDWSRLEEFLKHQLAFLDKDNEIRAKVDLVAQILLEEISHRRTQMSLGKIHYNNVCFTSIGTTGLLVDWLQLLDPELLARTPFLQRKLLFASGRNEFSDFTTPVFDQAYLLSLLAEHCNWENIHSCLNWLLSDSTPDPTNETAMTQSTITVDPKTALDFVWVIMQAPKIWKGRENKSSSLNEPVLRLSTQQFSRLLSYVVAATANQNVTTQDLLTNGDVSYVDMFSFYFNKFGQCKRGQRQLCEVVKYLNKKIDVSSQYSPYAPIWWKLLAQLYIITPNLTVWDEILTPEENDAALSISDVAHFADVVAQADVGCDCRTDALVCALLNRLGYVRSKSAVEARIGSGVLMATHDSACDSNLMLTKMASSRPLLVLRQLSLLSSMLKGRTRHDFYEFKVQHHLPLMTNVIGILRLLTPFLYSTLHEKDLYAIMEIVWQMVKNYCHKARRQMFPVLTKTLALTHDYMSHAPTHASKLLFEHSTTFQMLLKTYTDHESITSLVSSLQSAVFCWSSNIDGAGPSSALRPSFLPRSVVSASKDKPIPLYLELLSDKEDLENILQVLAEFDESSKRRIDNIGPYMKRLCSIFSRSGDPSVRLTAFSAALRHANTAPKSAVANIYPEYINCLKQTSSSCNRENYAKVPLNQDSSSSTDASRPLFCDGAARDLAQFLPDICVLCRENAVQLLGIAFDAGLKCGAAYSFPKSITGSSQNNDITNLLARSLWLLAGLDEADMKPKS